MSALCSADIRAWQGAAARYTALLLCRQQAQGLPLCQRAEQGGHDKAGGRHV